MFFVKVLVFIGFFALVQNQFEDPEKPLVELYYEPLTETSNEFITQSFYPAFAPLRDHLRIELIPYGKDKYFYNKLKAFTCTNGTLESECRGYKVHLCATSSHSKGSAILAFINCIIKSDYSKTDIKRCTFESNMAYEWDIETCANRSVLDSVINDYRNRTDTLDLDQFPTLIFNKTLDYDLDAKAKKDFRRVACDLLSSHSPNACTGRRKTKKQEDNKPYF